MTLPDVIEETLRLQEYTNRVQLLTLALILICDVFIILSVLNIRKTLRINREWTASLKAWSEALRAAQGMPSEGPRPKGSGASAPASPVAESDAP